MFCGLTSRWTMSSGVPSKSQNRVRVVQTGESFGDDARREPRIDGASRRRPISKLAEQPRERLPLYVLHDEVEGVVLGAASRSPARRWGG